MRESTHQATRRTNQPIHYDPPCVQKTVLTYSNSIQIYYRSSWIYMDLHGKSEGLHPTKHFQISNLNIYLAAPGEVPGRSPTGSLVCAVCWVQRLPL